MKIQFLLSEKSNINSFHYVLKILYKNFTEVMFNFNKNGMSLSQFWEDKNTDRAKYFFFFDTSFFSKINCPNENIFFRMSLKEIFQKLKAHKRDIQEIYITITNESRDRGVNDNWCLVEFMISLDKYGSLLYRNGCSIERPTRDFSPITYYQHVHNNKELFFSVEPKKIEKILTQFRGEFMEIFIRPDKMELSSLTYAQKINIKTINCFKTYNYDTFNELYEGVNNLINPPNHLTKYAECCSKSDRDMVTYLSKAPKEDGTIKFYCPLKSEKFLMILKFKMKIGEARIIEPQSMSLSVQQRVNETITSMTGLTGPIYEPPPTTSNNHVSSIHRSPDISHEASLPLHPRTHISVSSISTPNIKSDPLPLDKNTINHSKKKKRDDFQFSQESMHADQKKVRKNEDNHHTPKLSHLLASIEKTPTTETTSMTNSYSYPILQPKMITPPQKIPSIEKTLIPLIERTEIRSDKKSEPRSDGKSDKSDFRSEKIEMRTERTERSDRTERTHERSHERTQRSEVSERSEKSDYKIVIDTKNLSKPIPSSKTSSLAGSGVKHPDSGYSSVYKSDSGKQPFTGTAFNGKSKGTSFIGGSDQRTNDTMSREFTNPQLAAKTNEDFSNKMKNALKEMKL